MRNKTVVGGVFFVLASVALLAGILVYSPPSPAAPPILSWNPTSVVQDVVAGETDTVSASFTASENLSDVVVRVVPELEPYVEVDPVSYESVSKGSAYDLDLTISAPVDAEIGVYDGTIQLRSGSDPTKTYAKPLPVELSVVPLALPPDPGEEGKATLEGIDSDGDGVRDDVQRYIALTYPDSEKTRAALTQGAITFQKVIMDAPNEVASLEHEPARAAVGDCLAYIHSSSIRAYEIEQELLAQMLNTDARSQAYIASNEHLEGHVFPGQPMDAWKQQCTFDPDAMRN